MASNNKDRYDDPQSPLSPSGRKTRYSQRYGSGSQASTPLTSPSSSPAGAQGEQHVITIGQATSEANPVAECPTSAAATGGPSWFRKGDQAGWFKRSGSVIKHDPKNKTTIFSEINEKLKSMGRIETARAPDVEYIFQEYNVPVKGCGACTKRLGRWGHALVKYTLPEFLPEAKDAMGQVLPRDQRQVCSLRFPLMDHGVAERLVMQRIVDIYRPTAKFDLFEYYPQAADYLFGRCGGEESNELRDAPVTLLPNCNFGMEEKVDNPKPKLAKRAHCG